MDKLPPIEEHPVARVGLVVDDVRKAADDFSELFGIKFDIVDVDAVEVRVGISDAGMVLVEDTSSDRQSSPLHRLWNGALANVGFNVKDLEGMKVRLESKGLTVYNYVETAGGMKDYTFLPFHGITITLYSYEGDSWVAKGAHTPEELLMDEIFPSKEES